MNLKNPKYVSSGYEQIRRGKLFDLINIEPQKLCSTIKIPVLNFILRGLQRYIRFKSGPHPIQPSGLGT